MVLRSQQFSIMLIEDEEIDANYFKQALVCCESDLEISIFPDGDEAIEHLKEVAEEGIRQLPDLILLDLNLPIRNGFEVLEEIRGDAKLMTIPIIIVSTSSSKRDIQKAYRMKVNAFLRKPDDITGYGRIAKVIDIFWIKEALLP